MDEMKKQTIAATARNQTPVSETAAPHIYRFVYGYVHIYRHSNLKYEIILFKSLKLRLQ
jgi:hypothetical protein